MQGPGIGAESEDVALPIAVIKSCFTVIEVDGEATLFFNISESIKNRGIGSPF